MSDAAVATPASAFATQYAAKEPDDPEPQPCECHDVECAAHKGRSTCGRIAEGPLFRVDMEDRTGTLMCEDCIVDALESGVFTDGYGNDPDEDPVCLGCGVKHPYNGGECCR